MTSIFRLDEWKEIIKHGTYGEQVEDILASWKVYVDYSESQLAAVHAELAEARKIIVKHAENGDWLEEGVEELGAQLAALQAENARMRGHIQDAIDLLRTGATNMATTELRRALLPADAQTEVEA